MCLSLGSNDSRKHLAIHIVHYLAISVVIELLEGGMRHCLNQYKKDSGLVKSSEMLLRALWLFAAMGSSLGGLSSLQTFIIEQALWRNWKSVILTETRFGNSFFRELSNQGIGAVVADQYQTDHFFRGVVVFWPVENITYSGFSLLIICEKLHMSALAAYLNESPLTITTDLIVAFYESCKDCEETMTLQQIYRKGPTSEITTRNIGKWRRGDQPLVKFLPPELRSADRDVYIHVGVKNTSLMDENGVRSFVAFVEKDEEVTMLTLLRSLFSAMNISYELTVFSKLGWRNEEGGWSHMLGAIAEGLVDVAADTVDQSMNSGKNALRLTDPIVRTMSCVYFQKPENFRLQDVVRATFSLELQICVLAMGFLLGLAMLAITVVTARNYDNDEKFWEPAEAVIWTFSILCMQGSPWSPKSLSGCILLIFSLMFALITYNSYAAFITSVLSVRMNPFRAVDDLMNTDFRFGYLKGSSDEFFFRNTENPTLRALYFRGLIAEDAVSDVTEGIRRAAKEHYAFFSMARLARRALNMYAPPQWRCQVLELCVGSTKTAAGIPLSRMSPYNVLLHYWLVRFRETGILSRIQSRLLPPMPTCSRGQEFYGASLSDLLSAYLLFAIGVVTSVAIFLVEIFWAKWKRLPRLIHHHHRPVHNFKNYESTFFH